MHNADDIILTATIANVLQPNNESKVRQGRKIDLRLSEKKAKLMATGTQPDLIDIEYNWSTLLYDQQSTPKQLHRVAFGRIAMKSWKTSQDVSIKIRIVQLWFSLMLYRNKNLTLKK